MLTSIFSTITLFTKNNCPLSKFCAILSLGFLIFTNQTFADQCPKYSPLRYEENWSLANKESCQNQTLPIKNISLNNSGTNWLSLGGHMRDRFENWNHFGFAPKNNASFNIFRILLHADMHISPYFRMFIEGKSAFSSKRELPGGIRALERDTAALQQAFADIQVTSNDLKLVLRAGRQEYLFGKQRLISPLPWANTYRTWDGVTGIATYGDWKITGFGAYYVPVKQHKFNKHNHKDKLVGLYSTYNKNKKL